MRVSPLALRYAKALFDCSSEAGTTEPTTTLFAEFGKAFEKNQDLREFARSPLVKASDKKAAITSAAKALKLDELATNFLNVLADNDRLYLLTEISRGLQVLTDEKNGITRGMARSAKSLTQDEVTEISKVIGSLTGKKVILDHEVDPSLIGSLVAQVGSLTIDDSLKTHLNRLEDDLKRRVH